MHKLFQDEQKAVINLPARNDFESESISEFDFSAGGAKNLDFGGQEFIFPEGFRAEVLARWLEESLLLVEIKIFANINCECARCLKPVNLEISEKLMYLYYSRGAESESLDSLNEKEFDDYMPVELDYFSRVLDVMPQIQESIYTCLPAKILCKPDCAGLCPNCGADLNQGSCSCVKEDVDPRLEALRNFVIE